MRPYLMALAAAVAVPSLASACGGLFCNNQIPVDQSGEQIVFGVDGDQVEVHVRIEYSGPSEAFSWVLPLPAEPTVGLSTGLLFTLLEPPTRPQFRADWQDNPDCPVGNRCLTGIPSDTVSFDTALPSSPDVAEPVVQVLQSGSVGPFDYHVIEAAEGAPATAVFDWLDANDYDQPEDAQALIEYYAAINFKFVAVKLQKDQPVGAIRPLRLRYTSPTWACIPLRLTSIAATADMPVRAWILAKARAVPLNYFNITLNPAAYPWLRCASPIGPLAGCATFQPQNCATALNDLLTPAADQAGGRAFVTEYAGTTPSVNLFTLTEGLPNAATWDQWMALEAPGEFIRTVLSRYGVDSEVLPVYREHLPPLPDAPPNCQPATGLYQWFAGCDAWWPTEVDRDALRAGLLAASNEPREAASALLASRPYTTRLFTTVSPNEMTLDPLFSFNPDLPNVSPIHTVVIRPYCGGDGTPSGATLAFQNGGTLQVPGSWDNGFSAAVNPTADQPAVGQIQVMNESGPPVVVAESEIVQRQIEIEGRGPTEGRSDVTSDPKDEPDDPTGLFGETDDQVLPDPRPEPAAASGGCTAGGGPAPAGWLYFVLLVAVLARTRRARPDHG